MMKSVIQQMDNTMHYKNNYRKRSCCSISQEYGKIRRIAHIMSGEGLRNLCKRKQIFVVPFLLACSVFSSVEAIAKDYSFSWQASTESLTGYKLYYKKGGVGVVKSAPFDGTGANEGSSPIILSNNQASFTVTGLDESAIYYFTLTAYNENGESDYADIVTVGPRPTIQMIQLK